MASTTTSSAPHAPAAPAAWRAVALPTEHGGWGLTAEPVLLGLLIMPSAAGVLLGLAAVLAFVARTPLKVVLVDRWRGRALDRTRLAQRIAGVELAVLAGLVLLAAALASGPFWLPLVVAVPLIGLELWFDMRSRSRRLVPELAGTIGIGSVAAAIVLAGGATATAAILAWAVIAGRAVASLPFVRFQLRRAKGHPARRWAQDLAQVGVAAGALAAAGTTELPWAAAIALTGLAAVQLLLARVPPPRAAIIGVQQLMLGLILAVTAGLSIPPT